MATDPRDFEDIYAPWRKDLRKLKSGKIRDAGYKIDIEIPTLVYDKSARAYNAPFAESIRDIIQTQLRNTKESVKPSTVERRLRYQRQGASGGQINPKTGKRKADNYMRRYAGGRTGHTPPMRARINAYAYDSGRMAEGIVVNLRRRASTLKSSATINTTANRLNESRFGNRGIDAAQFQNMIDRLAVIAPAMTGRFTGAQARELKNATDALREIVFATNEAKIAELKRKQRKALLGLARQIAQIAGL